MNYTFSPEKFINNFKVDIDKKKGADALRLINKQGIRIKIFPYSATSNKQAPIVTDLKDIIGDFVQKILNIKAFNANFGQIKQYIQDEVNVSEQNDLDELIENIRLLFFRNGKFVTNNIGLYAYQGKPEKGSKETERYNKSVNELSTFLYNVFNIGEEDEQLIKSVMEHYQYNVLEKLIIDAIRSSEKIKVNETREENIYFTEFKRAGKMFKKDFHFMLNNGMTTPKDLSNLFALYYLFYTSQTCVLLDSFGSGEENKLVPMYFALDWEKVSKNRKACQEGWKKLEQKVNHILYHAVTLELLNQIDDEKVVYDYKSLSYFVESGELNDHRTAEEIRKIEQFYTDAIGDYKGFNTIPKKYGKNETDSAMRHLFECVQAQFEHTKRKRASSAYCEKLTSFYKNRWLKNRKRAGLVFNLTESDIIFLTKITIQDHDQIRLVDLFKEYENRGIYLDNSSKEKLQNFFTRLNVLDKKSDSGDAQYVRRIL
jgi:DNA phosphorothioation-dependent restriction protein DptG